MKKRSKRFKKILETKKNPSDKSMKIEEALDKIKNNCTTKFDESIDVSLRINLRQTKGGDLNLRTVIKLPNGSGKKVKVGVLCESDKIEEAKKSGADIYGSEDLLEKISKSTSDCEMQWRISKENNDFKSIIPKLDKVIKLRKIEAKIKSKILNCSLYNALQKHR